MRLVSLLLVFVGLIGAVIGTFEGASALFTWNGRHPIRERSLGPAPAAEGWEGGYHIVERLVPEPRRRYVVSVEVAFDRASAVEDAEGLARVEARMPLVVQVKDKTGRSIAGVSGWLDPSAPPNVLYGQSARAGTRGPGPPLVVERLVGPFMVSDVDPLSIEVDLGPDRVERARVLERRLVIYDDRIPPSVRNAFVVAGLGVVALFAGLGLIVIRWWRRRGGAPRRKTVAVRSAASSNVRS